MSIDRRDQMTVSASCKQNGAQRALHDKLTQRLRELEEHHQQELAAIHRGQVHSEEVLDRGEEAAADVDRELSMAIDAHWIDELTHVKAALRRIESGTYGICKACGNEIEAARLQANPSASRCISCQQSHEANSN